MIIWLASYPRSGNTYYRMLLHRMHGIDTYSVYEREEWPEWNPMGHQPLPAPVEELAARPELYMVKTHEMPSDDRPAVYLLRDGRDAMVSYANHILSFKTVAVRVKKLLGIYTFRRFLKEMILTGRHHSSWSEHVSAWMSRDQNAVTVLVRYEVLVADPVAWLGKSLAPLPIDLPAANGDIPSFGDLHQKMPEFFRRGRVGAWREEMPEDLCELFWQRHGKVMQAFGYTRD